MHTSTRTPGRTTRASAGIVAASLWFACVAPALTAAPPPARPSDTPPNPNIAAPTAGDATGRSDGSAPRATLSRSSLVFTITSRWPGTTAYRVERDITSRIAQAVKTLPGVLDIHSSATIGRAQTDVTFDGRTDAATTTSKVPQG